MSNVYTMVPKKPAQYNILTKQERLVYVPLATTETAGIASFNNKDFVVNDGKVNIHPDILNQIDKNTNDVKNLQNTKVDKEYGYTGYNQKVLNEAAGLGLKVEEKSGDTTITKQIDGRDLRLFETVKGGTNVRYDKRTELQFKNPSSIINDDISIVYNKHDLQNGKSDEFNGEIATRPYVDAKDELVKGYVDNKVTEIKKSVGYVFDTFVNFVSWIDGSYTRPDGVVVNDLNVGDDIFIVEEGIPDYWVKSKSSTMTIADFAPYESGDYKPTITWLEG